MPLNKKEQSEIIDFTYETLHRYGAIDGYLQMISNYAKEGEYEMCAAIKKAIIKFANDKGVVFDKKKKDILLRLPEVKKEEPIAFHLSTGDYFKIPKQYEIKRPKFKPNK